MNPSIPTKIAQCRQLLQEIESLLGSPDPTAAESDIMSTGVPAEKPRDYTAPGAWSYARLLPEYKELIAIIGAGKITRDDQWLPFGRMLMKYKSSKRNGWGKLLWAAEHTEPSKRWSQDIEQVLLDKERSMTSAY